VGPARRSKFLFFIPWFFFFDSGGSSVGIEKEKGRMHRRRREMSKLWILRGAHEAPGWNALRKDYEDEKVDIIHLDAKVWAVIDADREPAGYEGLHAEEPEDGMYIDPNGSPLFLFGGKVLPTAEALVSALGRRAEQLMEQTGQAETVLERLGMVY
jgi:hypothetical protein